MDGSICSDHNAIYFEIEIYKEVAAQNTGIEEEDEPLKYNINKINKKKFESKLELPQIAIGADLDELALKIEHSKIRAIESALPPRREDKKKITTPFWSGELDGLKRITRS